MNSPSPHSEGTPQGPVEETCCPLQAGEWGRRCAAHPSYETRWCPDLGPGELVRLTGSQRSERPGTTQQLDVRILDEPGAGSQREGTL